MNFFKKMMGFSTNDLQSQIENTKIDGTFYRVIKDTRDILIRNAKISFENDMNNYLIKFTSQIGEEEKQYAFPIYTDMDIVRFNMNKQGKMNSCFEWKIDQGDHVGCYMNPMDQQKFQDIVCKVLKLLYDDQNIKDHMKLCKPLNGVPVYKKSQKSEQQKSNVSSSTISKAKLADINDVLLKQASKKENKMVHTAMQYEIIGKQRTLVNQLVVFVLKNVDKFEYQLQLINASGYTYARKQLTSALIYQINTDLSYIRWLHDKENYKIIEVNFQGKKDASLSLKYAVVECQYEQNTKRRLQDAVAEDQVSYLQRISEKVQTSNKVVKTYEDVQEQIQIKDMKFVYGNKKAQQGLQKYRNLCQGKVNNFDIASLGSMLEVLKISEDNDIQRVQLKKIEPSSKENVNFDSIHLHDNDSKAVLNGEDGKLYYYDLGKQKIVQEYDISTKGIQDICPQYKLAEISDFKTFKAVSPNSIFQVDPRIKEGITNSKSYSTNPEFNHISADGKGNFAVSSMNGDIRLYDKIGKNANCKYPAFGDPVLHLDTTRDGKWLLATFKTYLLLLPTETEDDVSLYQNKIKIDERPRPIKLKIKLQHIQMCKVREVEMVPAKFEERKDGKQRFIVSGFGEIVVIWNLARVIRGDIDSYRFTNIGGQLVQTDFMFNNAKKLLMTTNNGIVIKQNKVQ